MCSQSVTCTEALEITFHQSMAERAAAEEVQNITILFGNFSEHSKVIRILATEVHTRNGLGIFNNVKTAIR